MIALLDGDIYAYRVGYTTNEVDLAIAIWRLDEMVSNTLDEVGATAHKIYLSDSEGNFRRTLFPAYKANRTAAKPKWLEELKEHLIVHWGASISFGQEADDELGIEQSREWLMEHSFDSSGPYAYDETIICSIDKDLLQIPGRHYNFVKKEFQEIQDGTKFFYTQLLTGDVVDNIKGVEGIGKVKAAKILEAASDEESLYGAVRTTYEKHYGEEGLKLMLVYGQLLKIRTQKDELWTFPVVDIPLA